MSDLINQIKTIMLSNGLKDVDSRNTNNFVIVRGYLKKGCALVFQTDGANKNEYCTILSDKKTKANAVWRNSTTNDFQRIIDSAKSRVGKTPNSNLSKTNVTVLIISSMMLASFTGVVVSRFNNQNCPQSNELTILQA